MLYNLSTSTPVPCNSHTISRVGVFVKERVIINLKKRLSGLKQHFSSLKQNCWRKLFTNHEYLQHLESAATVSAETCHTSLHFFSFSGISFTFMSQQVPIVPFQNSCGHELQNVPELHVLTCVGSFISQLSKSNHHWKQSSCRSSRKKQDASLNH